MSDLIRENKEWLKNNMDVLECPGGATRQFYDAEPVQKKVIGLTARLTQEEAASGELEMKLTQIKLEAQKLLSCDSATEHDEQLKRLIEVIEGE